MVRRFSPLSWCLPGLLYRSACVQRESRQALSASDIAIQSLSCFLSPSLSARARREEEKRERGSSSKIDGRDAQVFLSLVFSFPCSPAHSNSNLLSLPIPLPAITAAPSRHQGKNGFEKREKRGRSLLSFLASLSLFQCLSLFLSLTNQTPPYLSLPSSPNSPTEALLPADRPRQGR